MDILEGGQGISLRRLSIEDLKEVKIVYENNPKFFELLFGEKDVPMEYIVSEIVEGPPNFDKNKEYFMGIYLKENHHMIGVADFLVSYPEEGKGCFGLLLLSEQYQDKGFGKKTVELVEKWAFEGFGVRKITLGVELVNNRAHNFWQRCGYIPTGEISENRVMGVNLDTEKFIKVLK